MEADHCFETADRRSGDGYEGRGCPSVQKHKLFVVFLPVHRMGAGAGLTEVASCRGRDCSTLRLQPLAEAVWPQPIIGEADSLAASHVSQTNY